MQRKLKDGNFHVIIAKQSKSEEPPSVALNKQTSTSHCNMSRLCVLWLVVCVALAAAKPTKEQLKLIKKKGATADLVVEEPRTLAADYHCEGCRVVLEELEYWLEQLANKKNASQPGGQSQLNPRPVFEQICNFDDEKQPKRYKERWAGYPLAYRKFCSQFLHNSTRRTKLIDVIQGPRSHVVADKRSGAIARAGQLCVPLGLCPAARYEEPADQCAACGMVVRDLDSMLSRMGVTADTEELTAIVHENVEHQVDWQTGRWQTDRPAARALCRLARSRLTLGAPPLPVQCEALPWRFVGAERPTNLLEGACQELVESHDDDMVAACRRDAPARVHALEEVCAGQVGAGGRVGGVAVQRALPPLWRRTIAVCTAMIVTVPPPLVIVMQEQRTAILMHPLPCPLALAAFHPSSQKLMTRDLALRLVALPVSRLRRTSACRRTEWRRRRRRPRRRRRRRRRPRRRPSRRKRNRRRWETWTSSDLCERRPPRAATQWTIAATVAATSHKERERVVTTVAGLLV